MLDMFQAIMALLMEKFGAVGVVIAYLMACVPMMSAILVAAEALVKLTDKPEDDEAVSKVRAMYDKVLPYLEILPHMNLPVVDAAVAKIIGLIIKVCAGIVGAIKGFKGE